MDNGLCGPILRSIEIADPPLGELEMTMMRQYCRTASIRALLAGDGLPEELADLRSPFNEAFKWDFRGTRLNSILGLGDSGRTRVKVIGGSLRLLSGERKVLRAYLNSDEFEGKLILSPLLV